MALYFLLVASILGPSAVEHRDDNVIDFLTVRLVDRYGMELVSLVASSEPVKFAHSDWLAWVLPLALVELYFTFKWQALSRRSERSQRAV